MRSWSVSTTPHTSQTWNSSLNARLKWLSRLKVPIANAEQLLTAISETQWFGAPLVDEKMDPSPLSVGNFGETLLCVFQNGFNLLPLHTWKPLQEVLDGCASLEILKQRLDGHPRAPKDPSTTDFLWRPLNLSAF
jgi:hypothetical protein